MKRLLSCGLISKDECRQMIIYSDSSSAILLSENESLNRRNKHIDIVSKREKLYFPIKKIQIFQHENFVDFLLKILKNY